MSAAAQHSRPPDDADGPLMNAGTRTPRPYRHDGAEIQQDADVPRDRRKDDGGDDHGDARGRSDGARLERSSTAWPAFDDRPAHSGQATPMLQGPGSESGTEADDERRAFVRALPAPRTRPRKGLKAGEANDDVLLTPSMLDDDGRGLSTEYFRERGELVDDTGSAPWTAQAEAKVEKEEQEKLLRRRLAEFARRTSEVTLVAVIALVVLAGRGVLPVARQWSLELSVHVGIVAILVLAYPVKLSIVDTRAARSKLWERFRVPASFDPATVLYPPFLPVLVALSTSPANSAVVLPNIIIGISSLPQRLFPRSSRLGGLNALHWLISVLPLIAAKGIESCSTLQLTASNTLHPYSRDGLPVETLVSLYPLHHALLQPLHSLTSTSLLISELHLLSAALINLLLLVSSPQAVIFKSCLWIGGVALLVCCGPVLRWNVTLSRVPRWKLRRSDRSGMARRSLVDAVSELISLQRVAATFGSTESAVDSDADDDELQKSAKQPQQLLPSKARVRPRINTDIGRRKDVETPRSAIVTSSSGMNGHVPESQASAKHARRNTLPGGQALSGAVSVPSSRRVRGKNLLWYLHLTPEQTTRRKWLYAVYFYCATIAIVLGPVRSYVAKKALFDHEPIGWALGYLFGQAEAVRSVSEILGLDSWICLPSPSSGLRDIALTFPLDVPALISSVGAANVRLLLIVYWAGVLTAGLLAVFSLTAYVEVDTRRKVFHGVMVAMLLPATFIDPCFCVLALGLALAIFLLLEAVRAGQVAPLGAAIGRFVAPYVDGRDLRGPVVVSHIFLLIGCAVPLCFSLAGLERAGDGDGGDDYVVAPAWRGWELAGQQREVAMVAGVVCVGMGDAAASLIGRRYGRRKWAWVGGKSLEGSGAFAAAVTLGLLAAKSWLILGGWEDGGGSGGFMGAGTVAKAVFCACGASFMEAVLTGANDNVVVPVALWLLVKGVQL